KFAEGPSRPAPDFAPYCDIGPLPPKAGPGDIAPRPAPAAPPAAPARPWWEQAGAWVAGAAERVADEVGMVARYLQAAPGEALREAGAGVRNGAIAEVNGATVGYFEKTNPRFAAEMERVRQEQPGTAIVS